MTFPSIDTIATYGGALVDYAPVEDPTTDRPASGANQSYGSVAAISHCAPRAFVGLLGVSGVAPSIVDHDSAWGNAPGVVPTVSRTSAGLFVVTWPASVTDELGATQTLSLRHGWVVNESAEAITFSLAKTSANSFMLRIWLAGVASDADTDNFCVYVL